MQTNDIIEIKGMKAQEIAYKLKVKEIVLTHPIEGTEPWPEEVKNLEESSKIEESSDTPSTTMEWDIESNSDKKDGDDQISLFN